jgi:hypothetical protein
MAAARCARKVVATRQATTVAWVWPWEARCVVTASGGADYGGPVAINGSGGAIGVFDADGKLDMGTLGARGRSASGSSAALVVRKDDSALHLGNGGITMGADIGSNVAIGASNSLDMGAQEKGGGGLSVGNGGGPAVGADILTAYNIGGMGAGSGTPLRHERSPITETAAAMFHPAMFHRWGGFGFDLGPWAQLSGTLADAHWPLCGSAMMFCGQRRNIQCYNRTFPTPRIS